MIIFIYGEDTYRSRQHLKKTIEDFKKKRDPQGFNVSVLDFGAGGAGGGQADEDEALGQILAAPFLGEKRMCVLMSALENCEAEFHEKLAGLILDDRVPDANILVFWESFGVGGPAGAAGVRGKAKKETKKLFEFLKKGKFVYEFEPLKGRTFEKWILERADEASVKISADAVEFLASHAADSWDAMNILNQATAFAGGVEINLATAQKFLEEKIDDNIFSLTDAIVAQRGKLIFKLLEHQLNEGLYEGQLLALIAGQVRKMHQILEAEDAGIRGADNIAKEIGAHPFVIKKLIAPAHATTMENLKKMHNQLVDIDFKMKTSSADFTTLFALFVARQI